MTLERTLLNLGKSYKNFYNIGIPFLPKSLHFDIVKLGLPIYIQYNRVLHNSVLDKDLVNTLNKGYSDFIPNFFYRV